MSTILAFLMTLYFFIILLALWLAVDRIQLRLRRMEELICHQGDNLLPQLDSRLLRLTLGKPDPR